MEKELTQKKRLTLEFKNVKGLEQGFQSSLSLNGATGKHSLVKNCKLYSAAEPNADFSRR